MRWRTLHQEENVTSAGEHYFQKGRLCKVRDVRPGRERYPSRGGGEVASGRERCLRWGCHLRKRMSLEVGGRYFKKGKLFDTGHVD